MNTWKPPALILQAAWLWIFLCGTIHAQVTARLSSSFLARGEQTTLEVAVTGGIPVGTPQITQIEKVRIQETSMGPMTQLLPGRQLEYVYQYNIVCTEIGRYTIPAIMVNVAGEISTTEPLAFEVFNSDELRWAELDLGNRTLRYASIFRTLNASPYENETTTAEMKIYIPRDLDVQDFGIPDFERNGLTAWRFQPSQRRGLVNLLGIPCYSVSYPSTVTPTRTGKISIGPAKVRLITQENVMDPFPRWVNREIYVQVPKAEMEALPLPPGAPEGFENAVGSFQLSASTAFTEVQEGDPINVELVVSGSGNLDTMRPPQLASADGWKVYATTTAQRGDERRDLSGKVVFQQSIRPLELKTEIPSFRLVYFDPREKTYKSLSTEPIALKMTPSTAANAGAIVQTMPVPFEKMNDILSLISNTPLTTTSMRAYPAWLGHAVLALLAVALAAKAIWMRVSPKFHKSPELLSKNRELQEIDSAKTAGDTDFLKAAGSFIERHLGNDKRPEIRAVLAERDAVCFRTEKTNSVLDRKRRDEILKLLRTAAMVLIVTLTLPTTRAEDVSAKATEAAEAFESAKYDDAIKLWMGAGNYQDLSADALYNIGNACYRSGSPGQAALYYRRALVRDSGHQEARQNLRFIERKYGSITVQRPEFQYAIARFPITWWQNTLWAGLWLCGLALLVFAATRSGARVRWAALTALIVGPLLISAGLLGWRYFPNDAEFASVKKQAVIIAENVALHTDAARTAPEVIDAPPGSLCEVIRVSGRWAYVAFATKTRGWVPKESIEMVEPKKTPTPPKFPKLKADGKSA